MSLILDAGTDSPPKETSSEPGIRPKVRALEAAVDHAIVVAKVVKDNSEINPVLRPLKAPLGRLVSVLEAIRTSRQNKESWTVLVERIQNHIKVISEQVAALDGNDDLQRSLDKYKQGLEEAITGIDVSITDQSKLKGIFRSRQIAERIQTLDRELKDHFDRFMAILNIQIHDNLKSLRLENAERVQQHNVADEIHLIKELPSAHLANGGIHQLCMEGTRLAVLEEARRWGNDNESPQILWLNDVAGSGKSTVAKQIAHEWKLSGILAGRFFFSRDAEETRTTKLFFSTIAQQGISHLGAAVQTILANGICKLRNPVSATIEEQCLEIFTAPLRVMASTVILVLDALDECEPGACQQLLQILLPCLPSLRHLKLFLTSRPEQHIKDQLQDYCLQILSLRSDSNTNIRDVGLFMSVKLTKSRLPQEQVAQLIKNADGLFIWASTVCNLLHNFRGDKNAFVKRILSQGIRHIDSVYRVALDQAIGKDTEKENLEAYMKVLGLIVASFKPLSPNEINRLLKIPNSMEIIGDMRSLLDCHGDGDGVRFLHPTFREFLLNSQAAGSYHVQFDEAHFAASLGCLSIMEEDLDYDLRRITGGIGMSSSVPGLERGLSSFHTISHSSFGLRYSCEFWGNHVVLASNQASSCDQIAVAVEKFFTHRLLDWIYAVSLLGRFDEIIAMLRKLTLANITKNITTWSIDSSRFLKSRWVFFRNQPLFVYEDMAFTPLSSIFQQVYAKSTDFPHSIPTVGLETNWPSHVSISTDIINATCFSPLQDQIITGGGRVFPHPDPTFSIWNLQTTDGTTSVHPCNTLYCIVRHVSFNPCNSNQLQTGCGCGILCMWDLSSHPYILRDKIRFGKGGQCNWWSDDGRRVISQSPIVECPADAVSKYSYEVSFMDDQSVCCNIHLCWEARYQNWKFSSGTGKTVLQWNNYKITLWEYTNARRLFDKQFDTGQSLTKVRFSPDATSIILFVCEDTAINNMWPSIHLIAEDGTQLWKYEGWRWLEFFDIKYFPQGDRILLWLPCEVIVINLSNGHIQHRADNFSRPFSGHSSVLISPDGQKIMLIEENGLSVLNENLGTRLWQYSCKFQLRGYHLFSWKHLLLVEIDGGSLCFHDPLSPRTGHGPDVNMMRDVEQFLLSPNGLYLLIVHDNASISLWNATSGMKILITGNTLRSVRWPRIIEYSQDPSFAIVLGGDNKEFATIKMATGEMKCMSLNSTVWAATFLPISRVVLFPEVDGKFVSIPHELLDLRSLGNPFPPSRSIFRLIVCPLERYIAILDEGGILIREIDDDIPAMTRIPVQSYLYNAEFGPSGSHLYIAEWRRPYVRISYIDMSKKPMHKRLVYIWPPSLDPIHLQTSRINAEGREIFVIKATSDYFVSTIFIDCSDGRRITPPVLYADRNHIFYGKLGLYHPPGDFVRSNTFGNILAYVDVSNKTFAIDYSLWIAELRSQPGVSEIIETWRTDWLETLESYGALTDSAGIVNGSAVLSTGGDMDKQSLWNFERLKMFIGAMRSYGSLSEVLAMTKEGEQGKILESRVDRILHDTLLMEGLASIWRDEGTVEADMNKDFDIPDWYGTLALKRVEL